MRFARVLLVTAVVFCGGSSCTDAMANSAGVWITVSPGTVTAGFDVIIKASCGDNANAASVTSNAFGTITVTPVDGVLTAQVMVPANTPKATYDVRLSCPTGSRATTTLTVLSSAAPTLQPSHANLGPNTGGGFLARDQVPADRAAYAWLAVGLGSLLAAAAMTVRMKRRNRHASAPRQSEDGTPVSVGRP